MPSWETLHYGPYYHQRAQRWIPAGADKPWLCYAPGGGWSRSHPRFFHDPAFGEPIFLGFIEPAETSFPVACFSSWFGMHRYDFSLTGGSSANDPTLAQLGEYPTTPRYLDSGVRDFQRLVQHVKEHAAEYGIDPENGIVMGSSAGGQVAGCAAYDYSAPFYGEHTAPTARKHVSRVSSSVKGAVLTITPDDWRHHPQLSLQRGLFGISTQAEWDVIRPGDKAALSPLGVLRQTRRALPTFLWYLEEFTGAPDQMPPYPAGYLHGSGNGFQIHSFLESLGGDSVFHHAGVLAPEDYPATLWDWLQARWTQT